jgi:hypothetical protein
MSSIAISSIVFGLMLGGALLGMYLRTVLPQHHLSNDSKDVVKMGIGLVATMSALVLGLLVASAKNSFDALSNDMMRESAKILLLDRTLAHYGPKTKEVRDQLRSAVAGVIDRMELKKSPNAAQWGASAREMDSLYEKTKGLLPEDDRERSIQSEALSILKEVRETRWLMYEHESTSISMPMLIILFSWLITLFISFGLFAPANATVLITLSVSALAVSGAILLILELYAPYGGLIKISSAPLHAALTQLGN